MAHLNPRTWTLTLALLAPALFGCFEDPYSGDGGSDGESGSEDTTTGEDDVGDTTTETSAGTTDTTDTQTSADTETTGGVCEAGWTCLPEPGGAWSGPFALADAADGCGGDFPDELEALFADLLPDEGSCECSCGEPDVTCSTGMDVIGYSQSQCVGPQGSMTVGENECYNTFSASHGLALDPANSSCAAGSVSADLPAPSFGSELVACGGFGPGGSCDAGEQCVPEPGAGFEVGLCYSSEGDVTCPAGYPEKTLYFTTVEDTRSCPDSCTCTASEALCTVSVTGYASDNCGNPQGAKSVISGDENCVAASTAVQSIRPGSVTVQDAGSCSPGTAELSGEVATSGTLTVCCTG